MERERKGHPNIVNTADLEWNTRAHEPRFQCEHKPLAARAGGRELGCGLFRIQPGKTAFPIHFHHANEEAIYFIAGEGTLRLGEESHPVEAGDYIVFPAGGQAHQLINSSQRPLEYLCMSTMIQPEVVEYPDSGKIGVRADPPEREGQGRGRLHKNFLGDSDVDYYEGE